MKKRNFFLKMTTYLLSIGMSIFIFMGCQNNANDASQSNSKNLQSNRPPQEQMKKRIQDSIQPLITAGTITQDQADKIITAYSARPARNQQNKTQDKQQNDQQSNNQNPNQDNNQNRQRFNPLSDLVTNGVITQVEADAVMEKIKENSTRKNDVQNSQNNNAQSSN